MLTPFANHDPFERISKVKWEKVSADTRILFTYMEATHENERLFTLHDFF